MKIGIAAPLNIELLKEYLGSDTKSLPNGNSFSYISELILAFLEKNIPIHAFTLDNNIEAPITVSNKNLTLTIIPARKSGLKRTLTLYKNEIKALVSAYESSDCDLLHAHWTYEYAWAAVRSTKKHLITVHDAPWRILKFLPPFWYRFPRAIGAYLALRRANEVTAVSPYIIRYLKKKKFIKETAPIHLSLNGVAPLPLEQKELAETNNVTYATVLQGFTHVKNGKNAIIAFSKLHSKNQNTKMKMFGTDYGVNQKAQQWAIQNGYSDGIEFIGLKPKKQVMQILQNEVDVMLNPCREESFSLAIVEALMSGLAVIGGKNSGAVPDVLDNGKAGILCNIEDPSDIEAAMTQLLDHKVRNRFRKYARKYAISNFSFSNAVQQYIDIYNQILSKVGK